MRLFAISIFPRALALLLVMTTSVCIGQGNTALRLFRFGNPDNERPGVETTDGKRYDVSAFGEDYNETFFGTNGIGRLQKWFETNQAGCREVRGAPRFGEVLGGGGRGQGDGGREGGGEANG